MSSKNYKNVLVDKSFPFAITESFKAIRTNMLYTGNNEKCPVFGVTSSDMEAGKSIFFANIAQSFAQLGKKVALLDCDLRSPVQHKIFSVENREGMSEILAGLAKNVDNLTVHTHVDNLDLITAGHIPPNPTELLASENMKKLLDYLKESYDVVFLDLPPVNVVIDAIVPAEYVTSYVIVVRCGRDKIRDISEMVSLINQSKASIAGFVLNDVNPKTSGGGHYHRYYYSKYGHRYGYKRYGYGEKTK
jgi:capsular exopolysaccharide synthesis family protein